MEATLSASPSFASHCATTRSPPPSTASLTVFCSTAYRPMCHSFSLGMDQVLPTSGLVVDHLMTDETCDKRFDRYRSVLARPGEVFRKSALHFSGSCLRRGRRAAMRWDCRKE